MKMKLLIGGVICVAIVGGIVAYSFLYKKNEKSEEKRDESSDTIHCDNVDETVEKSNSVVNQSFNNMKERNVIANEIIAEIHDEMKVSQDNIDSKKAEIEKMMRELKK